MADVRKTTPATGQLEAAELRRTLDPGHAKGACGFYTMVRAALVDRATEHALLAKLWLLTKLRSTSGS